MSGTTGMSGRAATAAAATAATAAAQQQQLPTGSQRVNERVNEFERVSQFEWGAE